MAKKGSIFFISPYDGAYYEADEKEPWEYIWIGFSGISAKSIMYNSTLMVEYVQRVRNEKALLSIYRNIVTNSRKGDVAYLLVLSELYKFMAYLLKNYGTDKRCKELSIKEQNFRKILKMIDANCFSKIKTAQLAQVVGYEKTYVYRLFQEFVGISPQKYINYLRIMNVVQTINVEPNKNIEDLVFEAGFEEYSTFYRIFKQYVGCSPIEYKENFKNYNSENLQIKHMDELLTRIRNFKK
jgi:AraC-like DNA-binding protein